jgi:hypothetical protein
VRRAARPLARALVAATLALGAWRPPLGLPAPGLALAAPGWRAEFEEICARTQDAMALPTAELRALVARAEKLLPELERLEPTQRKVYARRLEACRSLYQFVLDTRGKG